MECPPTRAEAWLEEHESDLVGLPRDEAVAIVEGAGLQVWPHEGTSAWLAQEKVEDRINLWLGQSPSVQAVSAG